MAGGGGKDWEFEISRCQLLYIFWMDKQEGPTVCVCVCVCVSPTGIYSKPVINHNGKEYIYTTKSLCSAPLTNTTL